MNPIVYGVILCGGLSKRMGFDKAFIKSDDFLIKEISKKLSNVFDDVYFISNTKDKLYKIFDYDINVLEDVYKNIGPLGGIYTALSKLNQYADYIFVCACDMPSIDINLINKMVQKLKNKPQVVICKHGDKIEPLFAFYHKSCLKTYQNQILSGNYSIRASFNTLDIYYYEVNYKNSFQNLNTKQDLLNWKNKYE